VFDECPQLQFKVEGPFYETPEEVVRKLYVWELLSYYPLSPIITFARAFNDARDPRVNLELAGAGDPETHAHNSEQLDSFYSPSY